MKIKPILTISFIALCFFSSHAQKSFELGFNATNVVQNTVGLAGSIAEKSEPYTLQLRYGDEKSAWRLGLGGSYGTNNNQTFASGILDNKSYSSILSLGYERRRSIAKKLRFFYGAEFIYQDAMEENQFNFITISGSSVSTTNSGEKQYTVSPFFGLHYQINPWLAISTKSRLELTLSEKMDEVIDVSNGIKKGPNYTVNYMAKHALPNSIFVYFNLNKIQNLKLK